MTVNYVVQAEIVDIRQDSPQSGDIFLVDTNVWYWLTYPPASSSAQWYQVTYYPQYFVAALDCTAQLCYSGLSLAELASLIERAEYQLSPYSSPPEGAPPRSRPLASFKEYRHNYSNERTRIVANTQTVWEQITSDGEFLELVINYAAIEDALSCFETQKVDGYDLMLLETMKQNGISQIITDDGDYSSVANIKVFTANRNVINAAREQGKLLTR
jgi:predicted nucleic acid-binding protein